MVAQQKRKNPPHYQRLRQTMALRDVVAKIAKPLFKQHHANLIDLITHWTDIVGQEIAHLTSPLKLQQQPQRFYETQNHQVLAIVFQPGHGLDLIHQQSLILDRINQHLGGNFIHSLRFVEGVVAEKRNIKIQKTNMLHNRISNNKVPYHAYKEKLNDLGDENLRQILTKLGNVLYNRN